MTSHTLFQLRDYLRRCLFQPAQAGGSLKPRVQRERNPGERPTKIYQPVQRAADHWLSPTAWAWRLGWATHLGLTPQALCCRLLRRLNTELFKRLLSKLLLIVSLLFALTDHLQAQTKRKIFIPGQHAIVFDDRLSALREQPDVKAPLKQRLSRGRVVGILGASKNKSGAAFLRVAVSRNVRGWILDAAVARLGSVADGEKILAAIAESKDDLVKARMARLCADELRLPTIAPKALLILGQAGEHAAERLSRDADRRLGNELPDGGLSKRDFVLSFNGLDRYNRAGVTFDYDEAKDRIVYDGAAYQELLRRYPRSPEVQQAREGLARLGKE